MESVKLANPPQSYTIDGKSYAVGKLTLGMALDIESFLATLKTPLEKIEESGVLNQVESDVASGILDSAMQDLAFWPPDAVSALCDRRFLTRADFGVTFLRAMLRAYNPGLTAEDTARIAQAATLMDVIQLQMVASGVDASGPKDGPQEAAKIAD